MGIQNYVYAESIEETIVYLLGEEKNNRIISGGASITPQLRSGLFDCDTLIDISRVEGLKTIESVNIKDQDFISIGSALNFNQIIKNKEIQEKFPLLVKVLFESSDPARRNGYTFGGRLALKKARGMILPILIVMDALIVTQDGTSEKIYYSDDWLHKSFKPENVLITAILLPIPQKPLWVVKDAKRREAPGEQVAGMVITADQITEDGMSNLRISGTVEKRGLITFAGIESILEGKKPSIELFDRVGELLNNPHKTISKKNEEELYQAQVLSALLKRCLKALFLDEQEELK